MPELAELKRAGAAKRRAEARYRAALLAAYHEGASFAAIGRAVGITRAGARKVTRAALMAQGESRLRR